jgi:hypothetical protein
VHRSNEALERLEAVIRQTHRLYLASLMRIEALERAARTAAGVSESELRTAEVDHELHLRLMRALVVQLGYVPTGLAKRCEIRRETAARAAATAEPPGSRSGRSACPLAEADVPIRMA